MFATPPLTKPLVPVPSADDAGAPVPLGKPHALFRYAGSRFALPIAAVQEVIGDLDITPLPRAGAGWLGIGNLRGEIVPAATLAPWFSTAAPQPSNPALRVGAIFLILNTPQGKLALAADGFEHVAAIPPGVAEPASADAAEPDFVPARWQPPGEGQAAVRCLDAARLAARLRISAAAPDSTLN
jgi:chemotaxis signal transduction protein